MERGHRGNDSAGCGNCINELLPAGSPNEPRMVARLWVCSQQREPPWRIEAEHPQRSDGSTAPLQSVGDRAIDAARAVEMHSGAVTKNEPGLTG